MCQGLSHINTSSTFKCAETWHVCLLWHFLFISRRCLFKAARTSGLIFYLQSCSSRNELIWKSTLTSTKVIRDKRVPFKIQMQLLSWACGLPVEWFVESLNNSVYPWGFWWEIWTNDSEFFKFVKHWSELACWRMCAESLCIGARLFCSSVTVEEILIAIIALLSIELVVYSHHLIPA